MTDRDILPDHFRPFHYKLELFDLDFTKWSYNGRVRITGELLKPTQEIELNALELDVRTCKLFQAEGGDAVSAEKIWLDEPRQRVLIRFPSTLDASKDVEATLELEFGGLINHDMAGFYRSQYKPAEEPVAASVPRDEDFHYMMSTQFEACDARRAFPCFDEPNIKAQFTLSIEIPDDLVALSNMPVKKTLAVEGENKNVVTFDTTPRMSTYLIAWAVGDFEYMEAHTERKYKSVDGSEAKPLPVRLYTTRGLREQGQWALQHAPKVIDFFSERFGIDYPLPKSDILAVHEFTHGAMENWGLVTYRVVAVLFDEVRSEARFRNRVAYVVAHELAHQWFGNLVTMDWWDELWLNEGFATWAGWLAVDHLHPEWQVWAQFVNEGMEEAFGLDAMRASHPIQVAVRDALEVNQIFDKISYTKGCAVIRMLAAHMGLDVFLRGVSDYLHSNQFGNAKTEALWSALSRASSSDVNGIMKPWIERIGFPVLKVDEQHPHKLGLRQQRFLSSGDVKAEDDQTTWWLPLAVRGLDAAAEDDVEPLVVTTKDASLEKVNRDFYLLNSGATGFYRVQYPDERLETLGKQLSRLTHEDQIYITSSAAALAFSGHADTAALLSFVEGFGQQHDLQNYRVHIQALDSLEQVKSVFGDDAAIRIGLSALSLKLVAPSLEKVGWEPSSGEDMGTTLLRKRVLLTAVTSGHEENMKQATDLFFAHFDASSDSARPPIHADLRAPVYRAAIHTDPARAVRLLKREWAQTRSIDGREICLSTLGHVQDTHLLQTSILPFLLDLSPAAEVVPAGDMHFLAGALAKNRVARPLLWQSLREGWNDKVLKKLGGNLIVLDRLVQVSLRHFADLQTRGEIQEFFGKVGAKGFDRTLETVLNGIMARAAYRVRDREGLRAWLIEKGYGGEA